ncbi:unnamed protein product (macronuclear) [Paramecium tetraurelia]|uniref:Chromosome undetermined scaffold_1, whole genome shotgun sequence n=1 Tax=Paramecium tetraurelia TaxID=5888 RepID=Q6BFU3_PARTE|nr:hypothetical protein [Paramecium tetraurelia strain d4-2]XP_001423189.1 uncharacterized protein GSPATT00000226001 [Paramecium tetraurelia]CAH03477.1 hypothetical protein, transmembrane helix [Paramecium tetraurelia]CAK55791.1 unnamed protein product [Paramecium tetraurelia]|eukprot:XP_001423189.1 hypothetical protein (macronuclear) [Paramecium tetraurelia strain d4-2]
MSEGNNVFWQPFKTTKEFIEKDQKITKGLMQGAIFAVIGYGVGLVFFRARTLRGFTAGTAATWRFRDQIE